MYITYVYFRYFIDWNILPVKAQKLLILISLRTVKPDVLTAGSTWILNLENFRQVMKVQLTRNNQEIWFCFFFKIFTHIRIVLL